MDLSDTREGLYWQLYTHVITQKKDFGQMQLCQYLVCLQLQSPSVFMAAIIKHIYSLHMWETYIGLSFKRLAE